MLTTLQWEQRYTQGSSRCDFKGANGSVFRTNEAEMGIGEPLTAFGEA